MSIIYTVEKFSPEIVTAYRRMFTGPNEQKGLQLLRWRFEQNPHGLGYFALARSEDQIVGMIGLVAAKFADCEQEELTLHAIDTIVDPGFRGKGLFVGMGNAIYSHAKFHGAKILWGFPNDQAAKGWFDRLGWTKFGTVPFMLRPLRAGFFLGKIHRLLGRINFRLISTNKELSDRIRVLDSFDESVRPLSEAFVKQQSFSRKRDIEWLNWRLFANPDATYRSVGLYEDNVCVAVVSTTVLDKHGGRVCYVMEAMARSADQKSLARLLSSELARATLEGAEVALSWCSETSSNYRAYRMAGFFKLLDRLRPVELFFGARQMNTQTGDAEHPGKSWYISYLDSDTV